MLAKEIRQKFLRFFEKKGHKVLPSASLIPENDPTVLFTTAGMHPLVPYLLGEKHPLGNRLTNCQKCLRTNDIDEVGDATHLTFFEMLGNWSLGDYFKKEAIEWSYEFLTEELKIPLEKLAITVFAGEEGIPRDEESAEIWQVLGVPKERIAYLGRNDNWWGPASFTGPCGPDTEMFYWAGQELAPKVFDPQDKKWVEIWNDVFMEYEKKLKTQNSKLPEGEQSPYGAGKTTTKNSKLGDVDEYEFVTLRQKNVDTGMGLERITAVLQGKDNVYETELFEPIINNLKSKIENLKSTSKILNLGQEKAMRIIADHLKAATFILADGITPSNVGRGYVLRRLVRRAVRYGKLLNIEQGFTPEIAKAVINIYESVYSELKSGENFIFSELQKEEKNFNKTLDRGLKEFEKINASGVGLVSGAVASIMYQTYGFPIEMIRELVSERGMKVDEHGFREEMKKHQELSRTASAGKFKSGLADYSEKTTKYHTATHLLLAALRKVLGDMVEQKGSNITSERLRFDFSFSRKMSGDEIKNVEILVNQRIQDSLPVLCEEMETKKAKEQGAVGVFGHKYGEGVKVFTIFNPKTSEVFSKEICAGPHVKNTAELGKFKIIKEEASSQGVRRIKAILE